MVNFKVNLKIYRTQTLNIHHKVSTKMQNNIDTQVL